MAKLYNFCTYNGVRGGRYQSSAWDVCCDQWKERPEGNPVDWDCKSENETTWQCFDGVNQQTWTCGVIASIDWSDTGVNPQSWVCLVEDPLEWFNTGVSAQVWSFPAPEYEDWMCGDLTNPEEWELSDHTGDWEEVIPEPEPAEFEPILKDDRVGLDCGD